MKRTKQRMDQVGPMSGQPIRVTLRDVKFICGKDKGVSIELLQEWMKNTSICQKQNNVRNKV